jgi:branched-chain amino acid transport system ATP-binding protein
MLRIADLQVRYRNGALGVVNVSLEVGPGEVVVIFGPNGAGKTSTVRAISGFLKSEGARVTRGTVELFGESVANREPQKVSALGLAFVPERRKVFANMTVAENLDVTAKRPPRERRRQVLDRVYGLFPILATRQRELAGRLSGGQQQMLALGRSLMCEPRLLVVDEMTLGLHQSLHGPLFDVIRQIASVETSVLVVDESTTHALEVADRCYLLGGGTVKASGPPDRFRGNELLSAGYVDAQ